MKYLLKNIQISTRTNQRGEYSWLQADLFNDIDVFSNPARLPRFYCMTQEVIAMYEPYAKEDPSQPGIKLVNEIDLKQAIAKNEIPDISHITQVHAITMPLPAEYARVYRTDVKDQSTGAILHTKGEFIIAEGQTEPVPITSITLHIKKGFDPETEQYNWVEDPNTILRRVLERNYKPYVRNNAAQQVVASAPEAPATTVQEETPEQKAARLQAELDALKS